MLFRTVRVQCTVNANVDLSLIATMCVDTLDSAKYTHTPKKPICNIPLNWFESFCWTTATILPLARLFTYITHPYYSIMYTEYRNNFHVSVTMHHVIRRRTRGREREKWLRIDCNQVAVIETMKAYKWMHFTWNRLHWKCALRLPHTHEPIIIITSNEILCHFRIK